MRTKRSIQVGPLAALAVATISSPPAAHATPIPPLLPWQPLRQPSTNARIPVAHDIATAVGWSSCHHSNVSEFTRTAPDTLVLAQDRDDRPTRLFAVHG